MQNGFLGFVSSSLSRLN